jgi:hypothetical protein
MLDDGSGGLVFTKADLLEISQVSVPALPSALATARGINTRPLREWAERALDTGSCGSLERGQVEALYRAMPARPARRSGANIMTEAQKHLERAMSHRRALKKLHREDGEHYGTLADAIERTTSTLAELGYDHHKITRCMCSLERIHRDLTDNHDAAETSHGGLHDALAALGDVLPEGPQPGSDPDAPDTTTPECRRARVRQLRLAHIRQLQARR